MEITNEPGRRFRDSDFIRFDFPVPHHELRKEIWDAYLPTEIEEREELAAELAGVFQFTEGQVAEAVKGARAIATARSAASPAITSDDLYEASRKQAGRRLVGFARRIEPTQGLTLDDVILGEQSKTQLKELLNRVRLRSRLRSQIQFRRNITQGNGLLALFVGPSGTGKTLSAELVANEQGVDLYKVDLSAVVSKWVGETEKNLNSIFAEAEDSDALLFFDECDSLFGQRGEIADGRDRWANLQVNFLLQRVEEYSGVVIMATNLRRNIDEAFLRRIQVIIEFPAPDAASRLKIWKRSLPVDGSAVSEGELRAIAERFTLTGGSIRNIVIDAAFRALGSGRSSIIVRDLVDSVAREYQKLGKPITQGEFGEAFYAWAVSDILSPITA
jgi:SpoVK/Ycf46/Vps4 family AAA+-type ATPase